LIFGGTHPAIWGERTMASGGRRPCDVPHLCGLSRSPRTTTWMFNTASNTARVTNEKLRLWNCHPGASEARLNGVSLRHCVRTSDAEGPYTSGELLSTAWRCSSFAVWHERHSTTVNIMYKTQQGYGERAVRKFGKSVKTSQSYTEFKGGYFFWYTVYNCSTRCYLVSGHGLNWTRWGVKVHNSTRHNIYGLVICVLITKCETGPPVGRCQGSLRSQDEQVSRSTYTYFF